MEKFKEVCSSQLRTQCHTPTQTILSETFLTPRWSRSCQRPRRRTRAAGQAAGSRAYRERPRTSLAAEPSPDPRGAARKSRAKAPGDVKQVSNDDTYSVSVYFFFFVTDLFRIYRFNEADLRAEEAERKVTSLENEIAEKEQLHEELQEKYKAAKTELDELARQFDDL